MTVEELNEQYGLAGVLAFEQTGALVLVRVTLPSCSAEVYLHGAHLTAWQPTGFASVIFLSERSALEPGKAIRGGVPICFPWFANRSDGKAGPSHGFARLEEWNVGGAMLVPNGDAPELHLTLTLGPGHLSRSLGFDRFAVACEFIFGADQGKKLTQRFSVANLGDEPMHIEEALHTYFAVGDVRETAIAGLEGAEYLDKTDGLKRKTMPAATTTLTATSDRVFPSVSGPVEIHDRVNRRVITLTKTGSETTVVWNPWAEGAATIVDLAPDAWPRFVCVETANTAVNAVTLAPGQAHTMASTITVRAGE